MLQSVPQVKRTVKKVDDQSLIGKTFNLLRVLQKVPKVAGSKTYFECLCQCGIICVIKKHSILYGNTKSCGCLQRESRSDPIRSRNKITHGMTRSDEYDIWAHMKDRCFNKNHKHYDSYGGRGITICPEWVNDFAAFVAFVGPRPSKGHSIDRINNDGNYEPGNVRWATQIEQNRNRRHNIILTVDGVDKLLVEWAEIKGIPRSTIQGRLAKGWTHSDAVNKPSQIGKRRSYC